MRRIVPLLLALAPLSPLQAAPSDGLSYVLLSGKDRGTSTISGDYKDYARAEALRLGDAPLLYARQGGSAYVIRDVAVIARAQEIMKPQQELGSRQGALGAQQGELGRRQGELGRQQAELGRQMADTSVRRASDLGARMGELGRRQADLGAQQSALGDRQAALGREQARLGQLARPKFQALVADAIRRGLAQRVD